MDKKKAQIWTYDMGVWKEKTFEELNMKDWVESQEFDDFLENNNFFKFTSIEWEDKNGYNLKFHCSKNKEAWIVDANLDDHGVYLFLIENFPSMLMFKKQYYDCFRVELPEYIRNESLPNDFIRRDYIDSIRIVGGGKQYDEMTVYGYHGEDETITLVKSHSNYTKSYLKENFGIE